MEHTAVTSTGAGLWPLVVYFAAVVLLAGIMIGLAHVLGERHMERVTGQPYESGIIPTTSARLGYTAHFYLTAIFFVIFDLEAAFIFTWAIAFRDVGWAGYIEMLVFAFILLAGLAYLWRIGALDWLPRRQKLELERSR